MKTTSSLRFLFSTIGTFLSVGLLAQSVTGPMVAPAEPPSLAVSFFRLLGALTFVLASFFAGVWFFRRWQMMARNSGNGPRLSVLEAKSLGHRQSLYVIGYDHQRFLISSTPGGVSLVTHLPAADSVPVTDPVGNVQCQPAPMPKFTFVDALQSVLTRTR